MNDYKHLRRWAWGEECLVVPLLATSGHPLADGMNPARSGWKFLQSRRETSEPREKRS